MVDTRCTSVIQKNIIKNSNRAIGTLTLAETINNNPNIVLNNGSREYSRSCSSYFCSKGKVNQTTTQPNTSIVPNSINVKAFISLMLIDIMNSAKISFLKRGFYHI